MKALYFLAILLVTLGCQDVKYPEKPDNLIPEGKMIDVLAEVYLSNATRSKDVRVLRKAGYKLDSMLYKKFKIDSSQFAQSHAFYSIDLDSYTAMFEKVKLKLETLRVGADSLKVQYEERRRVRDSIKKDSLRIIEMERLGDSLDLGIPIKSLLDVIPAEGTPKLIPAIEGI